MKITLIAIACFLITSVHAQQKFWKANVHTGEYGMLVTNFIVQDQGAYFSGTTKPDAHKRIVGGLKGSLAKGMFQKDGSVMELDSFTINGNLINGYLLMDKKKYFLEGTKKDNVITADIKGKKSNKIYGKVEFTEVASIEKPKDYQKVWQEMRDATEKYIYNKKVLSTKEWTNFVSEMNSFSAKVEDDGEFLTGFFYRGKDLPFSHYVLTGNKDNAGNFSVAGVENSANTTRPSLKTIDDKTFLLDVPAFNFRTADIDSIMGVIVNSTAKNLIIDVRQNPGGDMEGAMRICQYIADRPLYGGIMLAQSYWNKNQNPPSLADYTKFKLMNVANYEWFKKEVKNGVEGLSIVTAPLAKTFKGKIFILTSNITASAAEPFVYTLQNEKIATTIGAKTAGAMVSMEYFYFENLALTIPLLDYYTYDGKRLDKIGVTPNIICDPKDALDIALERIKAEN